MPLETSEIRKWRQGDRVELTIDSLSDSGDGVGRVNELVVFVPDTVPGDRIQAKMAIVKAKYATAQLLDVLQPSDDRVRPSCIVADKCGGCQWQHVSYRQQLVSKRDQVVQALARIGGFGEELEVDEVLSVGEAYHYRNKSTYPLSIAERNQPDAKLRDPMRSIVHGQVIAGYYQKGSHSIVNLNQCPIQDKSLNPLLAEIKKDIGKAKWPIYDEKTHQGNVRHISLRVGRRTGEILLTIVAKDRRLNDLWKQCSEWMQRFGLVGVCLNINEEKGNVIFGPETFCIVGRGHIDERFAGLKFQISSDTFFQVYTEQAEAMLYEIEQELNLTGEETIVDAYCGIGTLSLPMAKQVKRIIGIEVQDNSIAQAKSNAEKNGIENAEFYTGKVEDLLPKLMGLTDGENVVTPDIVLMDPPRKGCDRSVLETLLTIKPKRIVYMSCNPATLARDLKILCEGDRAYRLTRVQPADFFPQTTHVESVAFLEHVVL